MKLTEIVSVLDRHAPFSSALSFDNAGILCGDPEREIRRILLAMDVTYAVIDEAEARNADLILTHHPALFAPKKKFSPADRVYRLIEKKIAAIAAHTNLDLAPGGVNDVLARAIGLTDISVWEGEPDLIGRIGSLPCPVPLRAFAASVRDRLHANHLRFADGGHPVSRVALCSGAGGEQWEDLIGSGIDTLVTGEAKYHHFLEAGQAGINLIEAGHYATEVIVLPVLEQWLKDADPKLQILYSSLQDPVLSL